MLRLIGSHYHFRRAIPQDLKALLGRSEISLSLRTDKKLIARERAADLYARTGDFFHKARTLDEQASPTLLQELLTLQTQMIRDQETTLSLAEECHALEQKAEKARHAMGMLAQVQKESAFLQQSRDHLAAIQTRLESLSQRLKTGSAVSAKEKEMLRGEANRLAAMIVDIRCNQTVVQQAGNLPASSLTPLEEVDAEEKPVPVKPSSPRLSVMAEKFIYSDTTKSPDTLKATRKTIDLFIEAFGDKPIRQITGTVAGEFFDLLSSLPATHGKGKTVLPLRMVIAQAQEQGQETVSGKTVKNHFSRLSSLWSHLVQRDLVDKNPWAGWDFNVTKKIVRRGWTDGELALLANTHWSGTAVSHRTWAGIITIAKRVNQRTRCVALVCKLFRGRALLSPVNPFFMSDFLEETWHQRKELACQT